MKNIRKRISNKLLRIAVPVFGLFITVSSFFFLLVALRSLTLLPKTNANTLISVIVMGVFSLVFAVLGFNLGPRFVLTKNASRKIADALVPLQVPNNEQQAIKDGLVHVGPESEGVKL